MRVDCFGCFKAIHHRHADVQQDYGEFVVENLS